MIGYYRNKHKFINIAYLRYEQGCVIDQLDPGIGKTRISKIRFRVYKAPPSAFPLHFLSNGIIK